MNTRNKTAIWGVLAVIAFIALVFLARRFAPPPKVRAQRITAMNNVRSVSMVITNTNALPGARQTSGK